MFKISKYIIIVSLSLSIGSADTNQSTYSVFIYIDKLHKSLSERIVEWSYMIDTTLSDWLEENITNTTGLEDNSTMHENNMTVSEKNPTIIAIEDKSTMHERNLTKKEDNNTFFETNQTDADSNATTHGSTKTFVNVHTDTLTNKRRYVQRDTTSVTDHVDTNKITGNTLEEEVGAVDKFFQNDKYLDQTEETFIRIRSENYFESKGSNDFGVSVRVQMPLSKTKKRFKIFVNELTLDNANNILKDTSETPDIGIHYFASRYKILSRYSLGFSGIHPFVKARYNMPIKTDHWLIDPIQTFRYSTNHKFEEETNIYFDRKIDNSSIFRILLHRKTEDEIKGMAYALSAQYFHTGKKDTGFGLAQTFYGNTQYTYATEDGTLEKYGGVHDYITSLSWRANIWRKWFYYEVRPSVSFHKQYDYKPNYRVRLFFDFYFGHHHKN